MTRSRHGLIGRLFTAGVAAAVAAARQGARVFLAERNTCLGGMGTAGMLPLFMPFTDGVHMLAGGVGADIQRRLKENGGTGPGSDVTIVELPERAVKVKVWRARVGHVRLYLLDTDVPVVATIKPGLALAARDLRQGYGFLRRACRRKH